MTEERRAHREPLIVVDRLLADLAGATLVAMMLLTVVSIAGRFLFSAPIPDMEAIAEMMLVGVVFLGLAYTQATRQHVEVTLFTDMLPHRVVRRLVWVGCLVGLIGFAVLGYAMAVGAERAFRTGDAYLGVNQIVTWPARTVAVVGIVALIVRLVLDLTIARYRAHEEIAATGDAPQSYE